MRLHGAIFDLDGTLTDSMYIWDRAPKALVRKYGGDPPEDLAREIRQMGRREASVYMKERFRLDCTVETLMDGINGLVTEEYRRRVPIKPGADRPRRGLSGVRRLRRLRRSGPDGVTSPGGLVRPGPGRMEALTDPYPPRRAGGTTFRRVIKLQCRKRRIQMRTALTIAGSDSSGGAGIQADIKTMTMNGVFAMSAITALTAQNTTGVTGILNATPDFLEKELDAIFTDIFPDAVKIGMVSSAELITVIADKLRQYGAKHIVVDPVMVATSGAKLLEDDAIGTLKEALLPLAEVLTPNIPEAEILSGMKIESAADMETAARTICETYGCAVLCKGGHDLNDANDLLWRGGEGKWFRGRRIQNPNTHGTGCTLSSAIASNLAKGYGLDEAVERAKAYISGALAAMLDLGKGSGPMDHAFDIKPEYRIEAR